MRYIFKNYLKTFAKNWIQTLGTILFIMMMVTIVFGLLSAPLQISSIVNHYRDRNHPYNTFLQVDKTNETGEFSNQFLYDYVYQHTDFEGVDEQGNLVKVMPRSQDEILSPVYKVGLDRYLDNSGVTNEAEKQSYVGQNLRRDINSFKQGGLIPLRLTFELTDDEGEIIQENLNLIINNLAALLAMDAELAINQNYGTEFMSQEIVMRLAMKMITLFLNSGLDLDLNELMNLLGDLGGGGVGGGVNIDTRPQMELAARRALATFFDLPLKNKPKNAVWTLSTFELFSPELYETLAWRSRSNAELQTHDDYNYDFNSYVIDQIFNNPQNEAIYQPSKGFRYEVSSEKRFYLAEKTPDSLFPKFSVVLRTMNKQTDLNQLQLETGKLPTPIRFRDLVNKDRERAEIPTIVLSSAFMEAKGLKSGSTIVLPESAARNNLLVPNRQPIDSFLTGKILFKVVGSGSKFDDLTPGDNFIPFLQDIESYADGYLDNDLFSTIRNARWNFASTNEEAFQTKFLFKNRWSKRDEVVDQLTINRTNNLMVYQQNSFVSFNDSKSIRNLNNLQALVTIFIILGVVVLILSFVFINFIIKKELNETRKQIGIFKSFGYKISELSWIFAVKTLMTIFVGIVLGIIMSIPLQLYAIRLYIDSITFRFDHIYAQPLFLCILMIVIPLIFLALSYFSTLQYLREPTLSLLSNGAKISKWTAKPSRFIRKLSKENKWFSYRLQHAFVRRSMGKFVVVQILFAFSSLSYTLMFGAQTLLYALVTQGFSALNPQTDHEFGWENTAELNISIDDDRFKVPDIDKFIEQNFEYVGFDNKSGIGEAIINDPASSDSRYRVSLVVDSYARAFDPIRGNSTLRNSALNWLIPEQYYIDRYVNQPNEDQRFKGANALKFLVPDYYLNWMLTIKINEFEDGVVEDVKRNHPPNFTTVRSIVDNTPGMRLDISKALGGDPEEVAKLTQEFPKTIFGMKALDANKLKNNLFLEDVTKIITLQLAEQNFDAQVKNWLDNNAFAQPNGWYDREDVLEAVAVVKRSELAQKFDPDNEAYWGLVDNPLIDLSAVLDDSDENNPLAGRLGFSFSKLPPETISLIMSALMLKRGSIDDINQNSVITVNQLFFNRDTEFLANVIKMSSGNRKQTQGREMSEWLNVKMFDSHSVEYGKYDNLLSYGGLSPEVYARLGEQLSDSKTINGIIPYGLAKTYNIRVGDTFNLLTDTIHREEVNIKVIGINQDVSFYLGNGWPIDVDYTQFREKFFDPELAFLYEAGQPIFNRLYSREPLLTGNVDFDDIAGSINSMKFVGKNLSISIDNDASIFGSIFNGMVDFTRLFKIPVDANFLLLTNPNIASTNGTSVVFPYNILRSGVDNVIDVINNVLILFMVLLAMLLLIILIVVMNIVVEEASEIILTLRAIGYTNFEVNWIVMGSYVIGALISFIIAYALSLIIWVVFLQVLGTKTHIYVFMKVSWEAPVITFLVIGTILFIGWLAANYRVNRTPLSRITNFS